jgi:hypothetical protein
MKKVAILALALAVTPLAISAQSGTGTVNAQAIILANLTVANVADVDFGTMIQGAGALLTPGVAPGAGTALGVLQIDHNSDVLMGVVVPATLTGPGAPIPVTFNCGYSTTPGGGIEAPGVLDCATLGGHSITALGTDDTSYIQVGGSIAGAATATSAPGTYLGALVFTITATY